MTESLVQTITDTIGACVAGAKRPVALHEPSFAGNEWAYVKECIDTGWVSSVGSFVDRYEADLARMMGVARAVAVVNGTAALHVGLLLADVERDDEVLLPALNFIASANAVSYCAAVPHFVDIEEETLGVSAARLRDYLNGIAERRPNGLFNRNSGRRIRALIVMHTFGHPCDLVGLKAVCDEFDLALIEDAAEALGTRYQGKSVGGWGLLSTLSFNGNKIVTTGGGGAILTNDAAVADRAKYLTTTARRPHRWEFIHDAVGFNFRMPNLNAALGCAQLEQLDDALSRKRLLAERYSAAFSRVQGVRFFTEPGSGQSNYWLNTLILEPDVAHLRDAVLASTNDAGLMTRPAWVLMHHLPMYEHCPRMDLRVCEDLVARIINIPSSAALVGSDSGRS